MQASAFFTSGVEDGSRAARAAHCSVPLRCSAAPLGRDTKCAGEQGCTVVVQRLMSRVARLFEVEAADLLRTPLIEPAPAGSSSLEPSTIGRVPNPATYSLSRSAPSTARRCLAFRNGLGFRSPYHSTGAPAGVTTSPLAVEPSGSPPGPSQGCRPRDRLGRATWQRRRSSHTASGRRATCA